MQGRSHHHHTFSKPWRHCRYYTVPRTQTPFHQHFRGDIVWLIDYAQLTYLLSSKHMYLSCLHRVIKTCMNFHINLFLLLYRWWYELHSLNEFHQLNYQAVCLFQEQAPEVVHHMVVLGEKDISHRPDRCPGIQVRIVLQLPFFLKESALPTLKV